MCAYIFDVVNLGAEKVYTKITHQQNSSAYSIDSMTMSVRVPAGFVFFPRRETVMDRGSVMLSRPSKAVAYRYRTPATVIPSRRRPQTANPALARVTLGIAFNDLTLNLWINPYGPYDDAPFPNATRNATQCAVPIGTVENAPGHPLAVCPSLCR